MISTVGQLFGEIDRHFLVGPKLDYASIFTKSERQVEGWFKGELLYLFTMLQQQGQLSGWDCEVTAPGLGKKRIDFKVVVNNAPFYFELKALYHGWQRGSPIDLGIYFYKDDVGIWRDVQKLASLNDSQGFCLLFIYPSPNLALWQRILSTYAQKVSPIVIKEFSNPEHYPPPLHIAKLEVSRLAGVLYNISALNT